MATNDAISLGQFTKGITNMKNYTDEKTSGLHFEEEVLRIPASTIQKAYDNRTDNSSTIEIPIGLDDIPDYDAFDEEDMDNGLDPSSSNIVYYISFMDEECIGYPTGSMDVNVIVKADYSIQIFNSDPENYSKCTWIRITDDFETKEITDLVLTIVKNISFSDAFDISDEGIVLNKGKTYISYDNAGYDEIINRSCLDYIKNELKNYSYFKSTIASLQARNLYISPQRKREEVRLANFLIIPADYSDKNNKTKCKIATTLYGFIDDEIPIKMNDIINFVLNYKNNINTTLSSKVINTTGLIYSETIKIEEGIDDYEILLEIFADEWAKYNDDKTDIIIEDYEYYTAVIQMTFKDNISINIINDIIKKSEIYIEICRLNTLTLDNEEEYLPTLNYHPATKKYVDDNMKTLQSQLGIPVSYSRPDNARVWVVPTFATSTEFQYIDEWVQDTKFIEDKTNKLWKTSSNTGTSVNENKMYLDTVKELQVTNNTDNDLVVYLYYISVNDTLGYATKDIPANTTKTIYCNTNGVCDYASGKLYANTLINAGDISVVAVY